jgi:hypothetical protein
MPRSGRHSRAQIEGLLRTERRRPMFGLRATALSSVGRLIRATRRLASPRTPVEASGVYDRWLDG